MTERWDSLPAMLLGLAARWRDRPMLRHWVRDGSGGDWQRMSWAGSPMRWPPPPPGCAPAG
ncbi:hypothetical protein NF552_17130 [Roseomonas mucosa]|nr:hypothetical protein NF552_17130 [Roseomonas mucosa]